MRERERGGGGGIQTDTQKEKYGSKIEDKNISVDFLFEGGGGDVLHE